VAAVLLPLSKRGETAAAATRAARERTGQLVLVSQPIATAFVTRRCRLGLGVGGRPSAQLWRSAARWVLPKACSGVAPQAATPSALLRQRWLLAPHRRLLAMVFGAEGAVRAVAGRAERRWCGTGRPLRVVKRAWASWQAAA